MSPAGGCKMPAKLPPGEAARRKKARFGAWYKRRSADQKAKRRTYCDNNRLALNAAATKRYHAKKGHPERRAQQLFNSAKTRAKESGRDFTLSFDRVLFALELGVCEATGLKFDMLARKGRSPYAPSLDREDCSKGYTDENTRVVVWAFNSACGDWGEDILWEVVKARWPDRVK